MQFPVYFHIAGLTLHPHMVLESIAYAVGIATHFYLRARQRALGTAAQVERNLWVIVGAVFGALIGAKLLALCEVQTDVAAQAIDNAPLSIALGGKTIVGGLVGGWIGIEIAKKITRITQRTGDTWVLPLTLAIAIGRIGCFLTGLPDHTYGTPTALPWAINFGDGIPRHPTQLYESFFALLLGFTVLMLIRPLLIYRKTYVPGTLFRIFMLGYCAFRFAVEFIKPTAKPLLGLSPIQLVCACVCIYCVFDLAHSTHPRNKPTFSPSP